MGTIRVNFELLWFVTQIRINDGLINLWAVSIVSTSWQVNEYGKYTAVSGYPKCTKHFKLCSNLSTCQLTLPECFHLLSLPCEWTLIVQHLISIDSCLCPLIFTVCHTVASSSFMIKRSEHSYHRTLDVHGIFNLYVVLFSVNCREEKTHRMLCACTSY